MTTATATETAEVAEFRHGRVPREVRRRQVLALAEDLFAERGYAAASMDELARRAGVSKPVVYDLVGSKEELFRACMTRLADELAAGVQEAVEGAADREGRLRAGALAWFRFVADHRRTWEALLAGEDGPVSREVAAVRRRQAALVADLLAHETRDVNPEVRPWLEAVAHLLNGAFESLAVWWADHQDVAPELLADLYTTVVYPGLETLAQ